MSEHPRFESFKARLLENPEVRKGYDEAKRRRDATLREVWASAFSNPMRDDWATLTRVMLDRLALLTLFIGACFVVATAAALIAVVLRT